MAKSNKFPREKIYTAFDFKLRYHLKLPTDENKCIAAFAKVPRINDDDIITGGRDEAKHN